MDRAALMEVVEATWPAARRFQEAPWVFRHSPGGGKRVTAASSDEKVSGADIDRAEARMEGMGQQVLFALAPEHEFDPILAERGYIRVDETRLFHAPIVELTSHDVPAVTAFPLWPPLQIACDLWEEQGIGPDRVAVMERAKVPRTVILGRVNDRAGGAVYVAVYNGCTMIHALEVIPQQRRVGLGRSMVIAAAHWGAEQGATDFALLVTKKNEGANALYQSLGMRAMDGYHYRVKPS